MRRHHAPPDLPNKRLAIICLDNDNINLLEDDEKGRELLSKTYGSLYILNLDEYSNLSDAGLYLLDDTYLSNGTLLTISPYDTNSYSEIANARDNFSIQKAEYFFEFCQKLGALYVEMKDIQIKQSEDEAQATIKGQGYGVSGDASYITKKSNELSSKLERKLKLVRCTPNLDSAKKLMLSHNLNGDAIFRELFAMRLHELAESGTGIAEYERKLTLVKTYEQSLDYALNLNFPSFAIGGGYAHARRERYECISTIRVTFSP